MLLFFLPMLKPCGYADDKVTRKRPQSAPLGATSTPSAGRPISAASHDSGTTSIQRGEQWLQI